MLSKLEGKNAEFVSTAMGQVREMKSGAGSEHDLFEIVGGKWNTPFNPSYLDAWVTDMYQLAKYIESVVASSGSMQVAKDEADLQCAVNVADHALTLQIGMGDQGKDPVVEAVRAWPQQPNSSEEHVQRDFTSVGKGKKLFLKFVAGSLGVRDVPTVLLAARNLPGRPITELSATIIYVDKKGVWHEDYDLHPGIEDLIVSTTHTSAQPSWSVAGKSETDFHIDYYEVQYCEVNAEPDGWVCLTLVTGLQEATNYVFKVRAVCYAGCTTFSKDVSAKTTLRLREEYNLLLLGSTGVASPHSSTLSSSMWLTTPWTNLAKVA